ncbi:metallophosphoesterase family protein [Marinobacter maroccanus]|uniref:metallophosphoesterase family protein n=1 Tax=Marinobacter maroccanus TaxID=2055143 RepID=UPI0026BFF178
MVLPVLADIENQVVLFHYSNAYRHGHGRGPGGRHLRNLEGVSMQIGVIADTHSKMRPGALEVLKGSDLILHAGDVGRLQVSEDGVVGEIIELPV